MTARPARAPLSSRARVFGGGAVSVALVGAAMATFWGFTVDDALITCRVAWNLHRGLGHRFNPSGPVVDAVTPLGFEYLLSLFAARGQLAALEAARWLGVGAMAVAMFVLGGRVMSRASTPYGGALLVALGVTAPIAAWASAGMETGLVTALAVGALSDGAWGDGCAALVSALRPELTPWCVAIRAGLRLARGASLPRAVAAAALPLTAVVAVAALRLLLFGRAAPLSVFAKPSDLEHGISYATHAFIQTGLPLLVVAPLGLKRGAPVARAIVFALLVHFSALVLVGGDWMSLYRLAVPVLPSCVLAAAELSRVTARGASWLRWLAAFAMSSYLAFSQWRLGAHRVLEERLQLAAAARETFASARVVATLDVGWVSLALPDATIVDLAGVTDERVAMLPGGHTSKRIDDSLLRSRQVDALVLMRLEGGEGEYAREVERRVLLLPSVEAFGVVRSVPFGRGYAYDFLRKP